MKCPNCGSTNDRTETLCLRCGSTLVEHVTADVQEAVPVGQQVVPDWRKEVTRKAREFGERKKTLTTPPRPLKENVSEPQPEVRAPEPVKLREVTKHEPIFIEPEPQIAHPKEDLATHTPPQPVENPVIPVIVHQTPAPRRIELDQDVQQILVLEEESEAETPLHFWRRTASLLVDHAILGVIIYVVSFILREFFNYDLRSLTQSAPLPLFSGLLFFHFLYYFYFLKTARQTPGQVFFSLEVREPLSGSIGARKIFSRWISLVFLNVLNVLPLLFGKKFFLMDRLSGTDVRSMKPEN
jgi:RDD family